MPEPIFMKFGMYTTATECISEVRHKSFPSACVYVSILNIEILERFHSKALRMIVDAPWYVLNTIIRRDVQIPTVREETSSYSSQYSARLSAHPNYLTVNLNELPQSIVKTPAK
jgi:hypothetical protein